MINPAFLTPIRALHSSNCYRELASPRFGCMIHFDDSSSDESAWRWFTDPACKVSYNRLYLDNGDVVSIADDDHAAWHAGACLTANANSSFYGQSAATNATTPATKKQLDAMIEDTARMFRFHHWPLTDVNRRIRGHDEEAIFTRANTPKRPDLWGKLGRKIDPTGLLPGRKIINLDAYKTVVALLLNGKSADEITAAPGGTVRPILRRGATGPAVIDLQQLLGLKLSGSGVGIFGPFTEAAVINFQKKHGLAPDGVVGAATWTALGDK
jgi:murein L,D-transpeptidase YcbB/YkuD